MLSGGVTFFLADLERQWGGGEGAGIGAKVQSQIEMWILCPPPPPVGVAYWWAHCTPGP